MFSVVLASPPELKSLPPPTTLYIPQCLSTLASVRPRVKSGHRHSLYDKMALVPLQLERSFRYLVPANHRTHYPIKVLLCIRSTSLSSMINCFHPIGL